MIGSRITVVAFGPARRLVVFARETASAALGGATFALEETSRAIGRGLASGVLERRPEVVASVEEAAATAGGAAARSALEEAPPAAVAEEVASAAAAGATDAVGRRVGSVVVPFLAGVGVAYAVLRATRGRASPD